MHINLIASQQMTLMMIIKNVDKSQVLKEENENHVGNLKSL
jgi:hypothetical protein